MTIEIVTSPPKPGTDEWRKTITASKVPTILGLSPWQSPFQLWHEMAGNIDPEPINERKQEMFDWGHSAELAMSDYWLKQNPGWELSEGEVAFTDTSLPFPNLATVDRVATNKETGKRKILEMKTANSFDSIQKWGKPGEANAVPANYMAQHMTQRRISGIHDGELMLAGLGKPEVHLMDYSPEVAEGIIAKLTAWHQSLEAGDQPELDDSKATYNTVRGLHPGIDRDTVVEITEDYALHVLNLKRRSEELEKEFRKEKSLIMKAMGKNHRLQVEGTTIATRQTGRSGVVLKFNNKAVDQLSA